MFRQSNFFLAITPLFSALMGFFIVPLQTWVLPVQSVANYGLFQYTSSIGLILITLGLDQAFLRELPTSSNPALLLRKVLLAPSVLFFCILFIIFGLGFGDLFLNIYFQNSPSNLIFLLIGNITFLTIYRFSAQETRMKADGGLSYFFSEIAMRAPILMVLIAGYYKFLKEVENYIFIVILMGTITGSMVLVGKNYKTWLGVFKDKNKDVDLKLIKLIKFGFPLALAGLMYTLLNSLGIYFIKSSGDVLEASKLVVALSLSNIAVIGQTIFALIWHPYIYKKIDNSINVDLIKEISKKITVGAVIFFICVIFSVNILEIILNKNFKNISNYSIGFSVLPILYSISEVTFVGLLINRKSNFVLLATASTFLISVIFNLFAIKLIGAKGVCLSAILSAFIFFLLRTEFSCASWKSYDRGRIYLGVIFICISAAMGVLMPDEYNLLIIIIILPYLIFERKCIFSIFEDLYRIFKINEKLLFIKSRFLC